MCVGVGGVVDNVLDSDRVVREFELHSRNYVKFWTCFWKENYLFPNTYWWLWN